MSTNHHIILRSRIEVTTDNLADSKTIQQIVNKVLERRITPILEKIFSKHVPHDVVIHLDKLVITAGDVDIQNLKQELPNRIEKSLMSALKEEIAKISRNPTAHQITPLPEAKLEAIKHYLSEGNFAWWMTEKSEYHIEKTYLELLHNAPVYIEKFWHNLPKKAKSIQRCVTCFSETTIEHTVSLLLKRPINDFIPIIAEVESLLYNTRILADGPYTPHKQLLTAALMGLVHQQNLIVDRTGFLKMLLKQIAITKSIGYENVLEKLHNYCEQPEIKSRNAHSKELIATLQDLAITTSTSKGQIIQQQGFIINELDKIGRGAIASHRLLEVIHNIKAQLSKPFVRDLVKSWLKEIKNRKQLAKKLPDALFIELIASIDPTIVPIFSHVANILLDTTPAPMQTTLSLKEMTLTHCAFGYPKVIFFKKIRETFHTLFAQGIIDKQHLTNALSSSKEHYVPEVQEMVTQWTSEMVITDAANSPNAADHKTYVKQYMNTETITKTFVHSMLLETLTIPDWEKKAYIAQLKPDQKEKFIQILEQEPFSENLQMVKNNFLSLLAEAHMVPESNDLDIESIHHIGIKNQDSASPFSLENVVTFLTSGELPEYQQVPAYFIAKSLKMADPQKIYDQLIGLCRDQTMLKKLIQHATEEILHKLVEIFIPFSAQTLAALEAIVIQSKLLHHSAEQTDIRLAKELLITAAIAHNPPTTEEQYIERIVMHLGSHTQLNSVILCDQLIHLSGEKQEPHIVETLTIFKSKLSLLKLNTIDEVDLIFLPTNESYENQLDSKAWTIYHHTLLPAIKAIARGDVYQDYPSKITQLAAHHLPMISKTLLTHITTSLVQDIEKTIQQKRTRIEQIWNLFLHTGMLSTYENETTLFKDVMEHQPSFSLTQVVAKKHVCQRLIAHFTHAQLILLVKKYSPVGAEITNYIQSSYQLWCATQGSIGHKNDTKAIFWTAVLETLPNVHTAFNKSNWIEQVINKISNALEITSPTLLQTFNMMIKDSASNMETQPLAGLLNDLQEKKYTSLQKESIQAGSGSPILEKLHLLLNGGLTTFSGQYNFTINELENELIQFIADSPSKFLTMLKNQGHPSTIARRITHYFSSKVNIKIIKLLAKEQYTFVKTYLSLFQNLSLHELGKRFHLPTWEKELSIAVMDYLLTTDRIEETHFLQTTLANICYDQEVINKIITTVLRKNAINQEEKNIMAILKPMLKEPFHRSPSVGAITPKNFNDQHSELEEATYFIFNKQRTQKKTTRLNKEVRVYIKNTGLVFLSPFLFEFFKQQHLMGGNQFASQQAAHNAVYLLQYLVTGKLKSPEWQLTLPKLLCGLSYDEVLLPYHHIDTADTGYIEWLGTYAENDTDEYEEDIQQNASKENSQACYEEKPKESTEEIVAIASQALIEKVTKRWTNLEDLSKKAPFEGGITPDLFRKYFLNRMGILYRVAFDESTEPISWHLTIMYQDDDLDLVPPWSTNKIKLPWMQEEIVLFWMPT
ncbi:contractile injection system tape measure protein [Cardinium endosymbiont of Culicoides punctatus]|uniref:contractile injection system tape measure protein n=1 Tax=Cardinium endosymbiont of Culicoides punctatus TaxID=2304601 RepID=UPI001058A4C1|nr:contractile injection system tape measure protein [Cardinium endosymbiont of Culicoides punctatus]TDG95659.1 hypothetical protein CCPUN_01150 [Cardinium endosymbiont of Culicoides punctatus]